MKKKEFKEYLKNEIVEILSEEESADDIKAKAAAQAELNKELEKTQSLTTESLNPEVSKAVNRFIKAMAKRYDYSEQDAVFAIQAALKQREFDKPVDMPGFEGTMDALDSLSIREEDEEPTAADLKKKDSVSTIASKLQKLTAKMKDLAKEFKSAEGDDKDKIKDELKKLTAEKKKLERNL
jgi:hypothetical protein